MNDVSAAVDRSTGSAPCVLLSPAVLEIAAGTVGGAAQLCVGHPFDTTKVKLQRDRAGASALTIVRRVLHTEGFKGLYAGITAPLPFVLALTAALFSTNAGIREVLRRRPDRPGGHDAELTLREVGVAGAGAGLAVAFIMCPTELVKCRMQAAPGKYAGALDCTRRVYAVGGAQAFVRGLSATLVREIPGTAAYFWAYEATIRAMRARRRAERNTVSEQMLGGGLAGILFWAGVYPVDYVKTMLQTDNIRAPRYNGMLHCMRATVDKYGARALYRGLGPAMARSFPATAITFVAYEKVKAFLSSYNQR